MKAKPATFVVVVDGAQTNIAEVGEQIALSLAHDLKVAGFLSEDEAVHVSPVRRRNSRRKTPFPKETVLPSDVV